MIGLHFVAMALAGFGVVSSAMGQAPLITEVLFHVPNDEGADANLDGIRDAVGDEFVEIVNPHSEAIGLGGVVLSSRRADPTDPDGKGGFYFAFPECELAPGQVAVVFNGYDAFIPGEVGTRAEPPSGGNEFFGGALVFSMENTSRGRALANGGDFVLLSVDGGETPVAAVRWGDPSPSVPEGTGRVDVVGKKPGGSVHRLTANGPLKAHESIDGRRWSPGTAPSGG